MVAQRNGLGTGVARAVGLALTGLLIAGCGNPYALNVNRHNYSAEQAPGVIQFSDPKLYSREQLINERRDELSFLETQLDKCKDEKVSPEIIRELEVVQSLSAGLGLKFDPAAAANFENQTEIASLKNEIARTRLEMQLAQVRRDAELLQQQLKAREEASSTPDTPGGAPSADTVSSGVSAPDITNLNNKIDELIEDLRADARENVDKLENTGITAGPIDRFQYRKACRDTVKNAINQVRLDELHDHDGNVLVRLQFRATVLPKSKDYDDTLGILRMSVSPPNIDDKEMIADVYRNWLNYVNGNINLIRDLSDSEPIERRRIRTDLKLGALQDYFDLVYLELPKYRKNGESVGDGAIDCSGVQRKEDHPQHCWYVRVALPPGLWASLDSQLQAADLLTARLRDAATMVKADESLGRLGSSCDIDKLDKKTRPPLSSDPNKQGSTAFEAYQIASNVQATFAYQFVTRQTIRESLGPNFPAISSRDLQVVNPDLKRTALEFLDVIYELNRECDLSELQFPVPDRFSQALKASPNRVVTYDVAPAERVQPSSTAARAAEAVALAASIAGSLPTHGLGASGEVAFSRSAVGRADALELAPIVVGFTEPALSEQRESDPAFGWLLGPKAVLNANTQEMEFVHPLKPYELFADLSVPGWWPKLDLHTHTAWAPDWRHGTQGETMRTKDKTLTRTVSVPLRSNSGDMDGLTSWLLKASRLPALGAPRIRFIEPREVSACAGTIDFQIWGDNVWRASMIHFGGYAVDRNKTGDDGETTTAAIRVLPDMRGVMASVDVSKVPKHDGVKGVLTVWTPDGRDAYEIDFTDRLGDDGTCAPPAVANQPDNPQRPSIAQTVPSEISSCASNVTFLVEGTNLQSPLSATFNGVQARSIQEVEPNDGTLARFQIDLAPHREHFMGLTNARASIRTPHGFASDEVAIRQVECK